MSEATEHRFWRDGPTAKQRLIFVILWVLLVIGLVGWGIATFYKKSQNLPMELANAASEMNRELPKALSETVEFSSASADGKVITLVFTIDSLDAESIEHFSEFSEQEAAELFCDEKDLRPLFVLGGTLRTTYRISDGAIIRSVPINQNICQKYNRKT